MPAIPASVVPDRLSSRLATPASLQQLQLKVERRRERVAVHRRRSLAPLAREDSGLLCAEALGLAHIEVEEWIPYEHKQSLSVEIKPSSIGIVEKKSNIMLQESCIESCVSE